MSKVFVSYKRADKDKVFPLVHKMESELGIMFWVDLEGIESDEQFTNVIIKAINECEVFLFMYSKAHENIDPKDDWTVREITFASKKKKRIVFIDIDDYELPDWFAFRFPDQQLIKANDNRAMDKLVKDIRKWLDLPQPNSSSNNEGRSSDTKDIKEIGAHYQSETLEANEPHQAIDLGLPSGTKWASCNVGATIAEEYGEYYGWYDRRTYKHRKTFLQRLWPEPYLDFGSDIAGTEYDVAHVMWGGNWKMPTKEQFEELLHCCHAEWITLNGVEGYKFTSKINGNSIFLPAAGYRYDSVLYNAGTYGYYWSSTQHPSRANGAYYLDFHSGNVDWSSSLRDYGRSVRPVVRN